MEFLFFFVFGLPVLGCFLTWIVNRLYGARWSNRFPLFLTGLLLLCITLALTNPTFEWGMRGAVGACALLPILVGAAPISYVLRRSRLPQEEAIGFTRSRD